MVTVLLVITFAYRTSVPLILTTLFQTLMQLHREVIYNWAEKQRSGTEIEVRTINEEMDASVAWRRSTQDEWNNKFVVLMAIPAVEVVLFVYSVWQELSDLTSNFLEIFYVFFCARIAYLLLIAASSLTKDAYSVRFDVLNDMINATINLKGTTTQLEAFMHKILHGPTGYNIFGFEISTAAVNRIMYAFLALLSPIALKGLKEVESLIVGQFHNHFSKNATSFVNATINATSTAL